jgi:hypothetical protein
MSSVPATLPVPRGPAPATVGGVVVPLLTLALLGVGLAGVVDATGVSVPAALAGGLALCGFTLLAIGRYDTAVGIGFLLMGVVRFEPAPPDAAFAVIMAVAAVTGRFRLSRAPRMAVWLVGALLLVNVLSLVDAVSMTAALRYLFITAYLALFALWLTGYLDSRGRARLALVTWLAIGVVSAVVSSAMLQLPLPGRDFILGYAEGSVRASGFFKDPNVYGPFLVPIAVILLEQRIAPQGAPLVRLRGWTTWLLFLALTLGVVFSYSRAAWANLVVAVVVLLAASTLRRRGGRRAMRAALMLAAVALMTGAVLAATGSMTFLEHRAQVQSYDTERFAAQRAGYELGWTHPVGVGPGQFGFHHPVETHSTFVRTFSEQGFLGLFAWVGIVLGTLALALRNLVAGRDTYGIGAAALLGAWCGLILNSVVVDTLHWRHLWVVAALIWAGAMRGRGAPRAVG